MELVTQALRAGQAPAAVPAAAAPLRVLVAGGGGELGSAVLEQLLGRAGVAGVGVLVVEPLVAAPRGLVAIDAGDDAALSAFGATLGLIVIDRPRHANGRERAFLHPDPAALPALATRLHAAGASALLLLLPQDPARLPAALRAGLASLDEQAIAALGYTQTVLLRPAGAARSTTGGSLLQRLAHTVLAQLRLMTPARDRPVLARKVARFAVELTLALHDAPPGTRVASPELVWLAAQFIDPGDVARCWLGGRPLPSP